MSTLGSLSNANLASNISLLSSNSINRGMSGWLRKRSKFAGMGHWPKRFVQLTTDGKLVIYTHDFTTVSDNELVVALFTAIIPKNIQIDPVLPSNVRVSLSGLRTERVFVIKVHFHQRILFTLGASSAEEAEAWKLALEHASKGVSAPDTISESGGNAVEQLEEPVVDSALPERSANRESMLPENWKVSSQAVWRVVEERDGLTIEGTNTSNQFPSLRASCTVNGTPDSILQLVMNGDGFFSNIQVVKRINATSDIVYMQTKEMQVTSAVLAGPRDWLLLRYWRQDQGDFCINWQSVEDSSLNASVVKVPEGFCRGKIFSMSLHCAASSESTCLVRIHCHADPGGNMSYATQSMLTTWLTPFVTRILGIESALDAKHRNRTETAGVVLDDVQDEEEPATPPPAAPAPANVGEPYLKCGSWNLDEWMQTPADEPFNVRGKTYLTDRIKHPSGQHKFMLVAADLNRTDAPVPHCASRSDSPLTTIQTTFPGRQVFVMQFIMPGPPYYILSLYAVAREGVCEEDTPFARLWQNFVEGTDEYRNTVFKMIPRVTKGSYVVKKTVGQVPAILGQKVKLNYYTGHNYIEVDVDLNTSAVAGSILSVVKGYATTFTADLTLLLEGHSEDELPEEIIVGFRMIKPYLSKALHLGPDPNPELAKMRQDIALKLRTGEEEEE